MSVNGIQVTFASVLTSAAIAFAALPPGPASGPAGVSTRRPVTSTDDARPGAGLHAIEPAGQAMTTDSPRAPAADLHLAAATGTPIAELIASPPSRGPVMLAASEAKQRLNRVTIAAPRPARMPGWVRSPRQIGRWMLVHRFGWPRWQFRYLDSLWARESGWQVTALNPYSGAYGIPQALPASKMGTAGPDWRFSARTQIRWGLRYIRARYRTPFWAWQHELAYGWY